MTRPRAAATALRRRPGATGEAACPRLPTRTPPPRRPPPRSTTPRPKRAFRDILRWIGEDPDRDGLKDTPARMIRAYREYFAGYETDPEEALRTTFTEVDGYDEMIVLRGVTFESHCEHHLAPIVGRAWVGYLPDRRVVGISKLARIVDIYARRLQIQERLTAQIANAIESVLKPRGVAVVVKATHHCMMSRGVRRHGADLVTSRMLGVFRDQPITRSEFLALVELEERVPRLNFALETLRRCPARFHYEGYAIVSADGMIADADGHMPPALQNPADARFFSEALDRAAVLVHGRHSHEGHAQFAAPTPRRRHPPRRGDRRRPRVAPFGAVEPGRRAVRRRLRGARNRRRNGGDPRRAGGLRAVSRARLRAVSAQPRRRRRACPAACRSSAAAGFRSRRRWRRRACRPDSRAGSTAKRASR